MAKLMNIGDLYGYDAGYVEMRGFQGKPEKLLPVFILKGGPDDEHNVELGMYPDGAAVTLNCDEMGYLWRIWDGFPGEQIKEIEWKPLKKQGHWTVLDNCSNSGIYCSQCNTKIFDSTAKPKEKLSQYCPHCGSRNEQFFRDGEVVFR